MLRKKGFLIVCDAVSLWFLPPRFPVSGPRFLEALRAAHAAVVSLRKSPHAAAHPAPVVHMMLTPALPVPAHPAEGRRGGALRQPVRCLLTPTPPLQTQLLSNSIKLTVHGSLAPTCSQS